MVCLYKKKGVKIPSCFENNFPDFQVFVAIRSLLTVKGLTETVSGDEAAICFEVRRSRLYHVIFLQSLIGW